MGITINASFSIIIIGEISAAISAAFSLVNSIGRILTGLKDVFQRAAVLGRAAIAKQLNGYCGSGQ